jgi:hypothetical protein
MTRGIVVLAFGLMAAGSGSAGANPIERACRASDRGATLELCTCIGQVADMTLSDRDQRRAARFFSDPAAAQEVRQSDARSDEAFWQRYRTFGTTAEAFCAG